MSLTKIAVCPDVHVPYHSERALALFKKSLKVLKPDILVIIGDFPDCYSVSRFNKDPSRRLNLKWEIDQAKAEYQALTRLVGTTYYCEGNHERRLETYLNERAPELYGLLQIRELLGVPSQNWTPYQDWRTIGKMAFSHDVGRSWVNAGRQTLQEFGGNIVFGHTHRGGTNYECTVKGDARVSLNVGWLGDPMQVDYRHRASAIRNSQHGFGWILQDQRGYSTASFIPMIKGSLVIVDGREIRL